MAQHPIDNRDVTSSASVDEAGGLPRGGTISTARPRRALSSNILSLSRLRSVCMLQMNMGAT